MTAAERKVRERYPDCGPHKERNGEFSINTMRRGYGREIGYGPTVSAAWNDAASRLTSQTGE